MFLKPVVKVIARTTPVSHRFVPSELIPDIATDLAVANKSQDCGSDAARVVECAGRTCYDSYAVGRPSSEYHKHIKEVGHGSVTEHVSITFYLDNLSRGCTHELVRHRAGCAISQRSTRYVDESVSPYILHPLIEKYNDNVVEDALQDAIRASRYAYNMVVATIESKLITAGVDKFAARKQARGAARGMLGNALCTSMVWTANIRALRGCIEQRANPAAEAEIRVLFNRIYEEALAIVPEYFDDYEKVECPDGIGYGLITKFKKI